MMDSRSIRHNARTPGPSTCMLPADSWSKCCLRASLGRFRCGWWKEQCTLIGGAWIRYEPMPDGRATVPLRNALCGDREIREPHAKSSIPWRSWYGLCRFAGGVGSANLYRGGVQVLMTDAE